MTTINKTFALTGVLALVAAALLLVTVFGEGAASAVKPNVAGNGGGNGAPTLNVASNPASVGTMAVTVSGSGFGANETLHVGPSGMMTAWAFTDASGEFSLVYTAGNGGFWLAGDYPIEVRANDRKATLLATTTLVVE